MVALLMGAWTVYMCLRVLGTEIDWALRLHRLKVDSHRLKQEQCEQILLRRKAQEEEIEARREKRQGRIEAGKKAHAAAQNLDDNKANLLSPPPREEPAEKNALTPAPAAESDDDAAVAAAA